MRVTLCFLLVSLSLSLLAAPSRTPEDSRKILIQELERIGLAESQIAAVIKATYAPFINVVIKKAQENYSWLEEQGVKNRGALIEKFPQVLGLSIEENLDLKIAWLNKLGVKNKGALIEKFPQVLSLSIEESLDPKVAWLTKLGVKNPGTLIEKFPPVLGLNIEGTLDPKIEWLTKQGVKNPGALIEKFPQIVGLSIEENLDPKVEWITKQGVKKPGVLLEKFPTIVGKSIEESLDPKSAWLTKQGVKNLGALLEKFPTILGYSIKDNLEPKVVWLAEQGVKDPGTLIEKFPQVLSLSIVENLDPSLHALLNDWGLDVSYVEANPMLLSASLERMKDVQAALTHLSVEAYLTSQQKKVSIQYLKVADFTENLKHLGLIKPDVESILAVPKADLPSRSDLLKTMPKWLKKAPVRGQCIQLIEG